jgi:hypothetical protein
VPRDRHADDDFAEEIGSSTGTVVRAIASPPKSIKSSACLSASHSSSNVRRTAARPARVRPRDHDGASSATLLASRTPRRCRSSGAQRAAGAPSRSLAVSRPREFRSPAHSVSPAQALTLYTKDADGSVKAVIAAKAGGLDLTVLPIAQYTGSADASQVRIAAIASPKPRRGNPETRTHALESAFCRAKSKKKRSFFAHDDANASRVKTRPAHLSHHPPS